MSAFTAHHDTLSLRHYGPSHGSHAHGHFQILLGLQGVLELEVQGRGQRLAAGDGCVIAPGDLHDFESRQGSQCLVLDSLQTGWARCPSGPAKAAQTQALARYLASALQQADSPAHRYGPQLLLDAWRPAPRAIAQTHDQRYPHHQRQIDWHQLTAWTQQHLHEPLTVAQLAAHVFLSPGQFAARCRHETGLSVMQWLRAQRLSLAGQLRSSGKSVAETALLCGYQSPSALTAALRRQSCRPDF